MLTVRQAQRRYLGLLALRNAATGLVMPVQMLLYAARGLGLPTVGLLVALYSGLIVLLELPTGGLADLLGRRRTMLVSAACYTCAMLCLAVAQQGWQFAGAVTLSAIARALGSGPVQSWYVDTVRAADPTAPLRAGLSRGWAVEAIGIGVTATIGGGIPGLFTGLPTDGLLSPFSVPALLAAVLGAASFVAHAALMTEPSRRSAPGTLAGAVRAVPSQITDGVRLAWRDPVIRLLVARTAAIGLAVVSIEILSPLQFAALLGGRERAAAAYGLLLAAAWLGSAVGSAAAPALCRLVPRAGPLAVGAIFTGLTAIGPALLGLAALGVGGFVLAVAGYLGGYLCLGVPGPLADEVLHDRVTEARRATLVSIGSLALQLGGLGGSLGVARLAGRTGYGWGWFCAALALALAATFTLAAKQRARSSEPARQGELVGGR
jgi:MFS family permease